MKANKESNKIMITFYIITAVMDLFFFLCMLANISETSFYRDKADWLFSVEIGLMFLCFCGVSVFSIIRTVKKKHHPFLTFIALNVNVFLAFLSLYLALPIFGDDKAPSIAFGVMALLFSIVSVMLIKAGNSRDGMMFHGRQSMRFVEFNGYTKFNDALSEYVEIKYGEEFSSQDPQLVRTLQDNGIMITEEERDKILGYAATPIAYILGWLLKNRLMSEEFYETHDATGLNSVLMEAMNPVEYFKRYMNSSLKREDISSEAIYFIDQYCCMGYYDIRSGTKYDSTNLFDHYKNGIISDSEAYCLEYDYSTENKLHQIISDRYALFKYEWNISDEPSPEGRIKLGDWLGGREMQILLYTDVDQTYIHSCIDDISFDRHGVTIDICSYIRDNYYREQVISDTEIMNRIEWNTLSVYAPFEEGMGYILSGSCEFDREHGIAVAIRNGKVVEIGNEYDIDSPWTDCVDEKYYGHR